MKNKIFEVLLKASQKVKNARTDAFRSEKLTADQYEILDVLYNAGKSVNSEYIKNSIINRKADVTRFYERLESKGYIKRTRNPQSKREILLTITEEGEKVYTSLHFAYKQGIIVLDSLTREELITLKKLLQKIL